MKTHRKFIKNITLAGVFFLFILATVGINVLKVSAAADQIYISPSDQSVNKGRLFTVSVHEDSGTDAINAVQANLVYPTSQLKLVSVSGSAGWSIAQNDTSTPGKILFAAFPSPSGSTVTGDQLFETVTFQASGSGLTTLSFDCDLNISTCPNGNAITRASDNADILAGTVNGSVNINTSNVTAAAAASTTPRLFTRISGTTIAKNGLTDPWAVEANNINTPSQIFAAGDRIGYIDNNNSLYVKQGLSGPWYREMNSVDSAALTSTRIVVRVGGSILAKDGLTDPWTLEATGVLTPAQVFAAGDRIGFLDSSKGLVVKQGLSGPWLKQASAADDVVMTPTRILVRAGSTVYAKDGLTNPWTPEVTGLTLPAQIFAAGDRIGFLDGSSTFYVKQGLSGVWAKEATSADDAVITPTRIVVRIAGTLIAKDGLSDPWAVEATGIVQPAQIYAAADRIGFLDGNKNLVVKQGLSGPWLKEATSVDDAVIAG